MKNDSLRPLLDKKYESHPPAELIHESPAILEGVSSNGADALRKFFRVDSIADLADCDAFLRAQALVTLARASD
jgi:hypothetical protein